MSDQDNQIVNFFEYIRNKNDMLLLKNVVSLFQKEDKKLSTDILALLPTTLVNKDFLSQFSMFLKYASFLDLEDEEGISKLIKKFKLSSVDNFQEIINNLKPCFSEYKQQVLNDTLENYNWQLAFKDKETDSFSNNKFDKVEIDLKLDINEANNNKKEKLIKLNYYEFSEILENLKKVENQLKAFK